MPGHDIVVIGTSSGGVEALQRIAAALPPELPTSVFIVLHRPADKPSLLAEILQSVCALQVVDAKNGEVIRPGRVYIAPPDYHMVLNDGHVRLTRGPKENRFRPAIDPLFRSAAAAYGPRVVGIVLTGNLDDGTAGLWAIKDQGGIAIVQNPEEALYPSMPSNAMAHVEVDFCLSITDIGPTLVSLSTQPATGDAAVPEKLGIETRIALENNALAAGVMQLGKLSAFTCPECHGTLLQIEEGNLLRFRCHTGHAYSVHSLLEDVADSVEESLWNSVRAMEELTMLLQALSEHVPEHNDASATAHIAQQIKDIQQRTQLVRQVILRKEPEPLGEDVHALLES